MKHLLLITITLFSLNINAQWYSSFGVSNINDLNRNQLNPALEKSLKIIKTGKTLTFIGVGVGIVGLMVYKKGLYDLVNSNDITTIGLNEGPGGAYVLYGGVLLTGIGIPVWISGSNKKDQIEIALAKFKTDSYISGIGLKIRF